MAVIANSITFSLCDFKGEEGEKVFFKVKDPTILAANTGLNPAIYYLMVATIINKVIMNCHTSQYTFQYDSSVLVDGTDFTKASIDTITLWDANTEYIKEIVAKNNLTDVF